MSQVATEGFGKIASLEETQRETLVSEAEKLEEARTGKYGLIMQAHNRIPGFADAARNPEIVGAMETLLGGKIDAIQTQFMFCPPGAKGFTAHQDNFFTQAPIGSFGSAWISLDPTERTNGGLFIFLGSHQAGEIFPVIEREEPEKQRHIEVVGHVLKQFERKDVETDPGDVVFLSGEIIHGSYDNMTVDRFRRVLLVTYVRKQVEFRAGNFAKRERFDVYSSC